MKNLTFIVLLIISVFFSNRLFAQARPDSSKLCRIETYDGNEFVGLVEAEDSVQIVVETTLLGKVTIPRTSIKTMTWQKTSNIKAGKLWFENPQSTRYFWSPNGFGLKKGEGYYQNIWVLWNQASVGVTDFFSIGAGTIPLFFFGGTATPVWIVPKFSIPVVKDKFNIGAGAIAGTLLGENASFGIVYGMGTIGNRNSNATIGIGYGYANGNWATKPIVTFSGMTRVSSRGYLITENYFIGIGESNQVIISAGGRSIIKKAAIDYGLFMPLSTGIDRVIAIPWLGFTVPFGKK